MEIRYENINFFIPRQFSTINKGKIASEQIKKRYNEEFDPGSGWTLATGLTHASRGAA